MDKVELFEMVRKSYFVEGESIRSLSRKHHVHRRTVRQALERAEPKRLAVGSSKAGVLTETICAAIDEILRADRRAPKKQRHTAEVLYHRLVSEYNYTGALPTLRKYLGSRRRALNISVEGFVPQYYEAGEIAEVDWYEAYIIFLGTKRKIYIFEMRACYSGREFHLGFFKQDQASFIEGHVAAFRYFGGVFKKIRYDNLTSAVKKVLKGRARLETERFTLLRSHYLFEAIFCRVGIEGAHEKGGVECGVGRFRRTHLVPLPHFSSLEEFNVYLGECCAKDDLRIIIGKQASINEHWQEEQTKLLALPKTPFFSGSVLRVRVNKKSLISVKNNYYSVPTRCISQYVECRLSSNLLEVWHQGSCIATHSRLYGKSQISAQLDHYLELLYQKPLAFEGALARHQAKQTQEWPYDYEVFWKTLVDHHGQVEGTRQMITVLYLHREHSPGKVHQAVMMANQYRLMSAEAIDYLIRHLSKIPADFEPYLLSDNTASHEKQIASLSNYNQLLK